MSKITFSFFTTINILPGPLIHAICALPCTKNYVFLSYLKDTSAHENREHLKTTTFQKKKFENPLASNSVYVAPYI